MKSSDDGLIRLIAIFKLLKAGLLIALGIGLFKLLHKDVGDALEHWCEALRLDPGNRDQKQSQEQVASVPALRSKSKSKSKSRSKINVMATNLMFAALHGATTMHSTKMREKNLLGGRELLAD